MGKLDGKVAIVTGGGRGLGRAYARRLASLGAKIALCDLNLKSIRSDSPLVLHSRSYLRLIEQRANAGLHVDALDRPAQKPCNRKHLDLLHCLRLGPQRNCVRHDQLFQP